MSFDEVRRPTTSTEELLQFLVLHARQDSRIADLVAVEVQDRQHRAVGDGIEKLVRVPCGCQRPGFRFAISYDAGNDQRGIVECGTEGMTDRIAKFATLVDRPGRLWRDMTGNPPWE